MEADNDAVIDEQPMDRLASQGDKTNPDHPFVLSRDLDWVEVLQSLDATGRKTGIVSELFRPAFLAGTVRVLGRALRLRIWVAAVGIGSSTECPREDDRLPHLSLPEQNHVFHPGLG